MSFTDAAPSWEELERLLVVAQMAEGIAEPDLENGPTNPHALQRLFGSSAPSRVKLYRDSAAWWCVAFTPRGVAHSAISPYCEKVWLQLEEKRIPYTVEKINMRCYG